MQYLLSEREYKALVKRGDSAEQEVEDTLQKLCTMVADHMPIHIPKRYGTTDGEYKLGVTEPWGCILSETEHEHYCDGCQVREVCPTEFKEWSK